MDKNRQNKFCANQMWYERANTSALNYRLWQVEYTRTKKILYVWSRVNHYFDDIALNDTKMGLEVMF